MEWSTPHPAFADITDLELHITKLVLEKLEDAYEASGRPWQAGAVASLLVDVCNERCARADAAGRRTAA